MEGQRERARAGSAFKGGERRIDWSMTPDGWSSALATRWATSSRATTRRRVRATPMLAIFDHERRIGRRSCPPARPGYVVARPNAVLRRSGRPGVGPRPICRRGRRRRRVERMIRQPGGRPRLHAVRVEQGRAPAWTDRHGGGRPTRCAMRRGATTRPRTCCTRRCARCSAATSSRRDRSSRPIACGSTSSTSPR